MSPLAFDKQGKPFSWHQRTAKLRVRLFRNPAARGTCCQVLDAAGSPLFVDAGIEYLEFRRITGNVPGLYRLDQCDEDGVEIDGEPAAYLTVEPLRNGGALTAETASLDVNALAIIDRLMAVQERMVASQADVMKQMASQHGVLMNAGSVVMNASAEIMRAPYRAPLALPEPRNAGNDDDQDEEDDDDQDDDSDAAAEPSNPFNIAMSFVTPEMAHQLGAGAVEKIIEAFRKIFGTKQPTATTVTAVAPEATPAPAFVPPMAPAPAAPQVNVGQSGVAAGPSSRLAVPASVMVGSIFETYEPRFADADGAEYDEADVDGYAEACEGDEPAPIAAAPSTPTAQNGSLVQAAPNPLISNAASASPVAPTQEQFARLLAIYQRLAPAERAIAQRAVAQMNVATRSQWIAALSVKPIDEATADIRGVLAQMQNAKRV